MYSRPVVRVGRYFVRRRYGCLDEKNPTLRSRELGYLSVQFAEVVEVLELEPGLSLEVLARSFAHATVALCL